MYHRTKICTIPFLFSGQPSPEKTALEQRYNDKENICKQNEDKGREQDPGIFLSESSTFPDSSPHACQIKEYAQIEEKKEQGENDDEEEDDEFSTGFNNTYTGDKYNDSKKRRNNRQPLR